LVVIEYQTQFRTICGVFFLNDVPCGSSASSLHMYRSPNQNTTAVYLRATASSTGIVTFVFHIHCPTLQE
jgi:hypothetical protein